MTFSWIVDNLKRKGLGDDAINDELECVWGWKNVTQDGGWSTVTTTTTRSMQPKRKKGAYLLRRKRAERNRER